MPDGLSWKLCDLMGRQIARLDDRLPGGFVKVGQHENWTASVSLSFEDPAAALVYPLYTVLKVKLDGADLFSGVMLKPRFQGRQRVVQLNAISPSYRMQTSFVGQRSDGAGLPGAVYWNPWRWEGMDQAEMFASLLDHVSPTAAEQEVGVPGHGIARGTLQSGDITRTRDVAVAAQIWQTWLDMASVERGVDFQLTPVDREDGVLCLLDTFYPRQGIDRSGDVAFNFGWGREDATDFNWEPDGGPVVNRMTELGQTIEGEPQRTATADQPESQRAFGLYGKMEGRTDVVDSNILAEYAQGAIISVGWPQDFFTFTPAQDDGTGWARDNNGALVRLPRQFGVPKRFGPGKQHDAWLGDVVRVIARDKPALDGRFDGRVTDLTFTEPDQAGTVVTEVNATPIIDAAGVTVRTA